MKPNPHLFLHPPVLALVLCLFACAAAAAPGAHGPNGEHLDAKPSGTAATSTAPRLEAQSELLELVAHLDGGEFSILIDRFATNEPVLNANVELESGAIKARAKFHADLGDYSVDDPAMLKLLSSQGEHPVVITVLNGEESDLLDGVLRVGAAQTQHAVHAHEHGSHWWSWGLGGLIVLILAIGWRWKHRGTGAASTRTRNGGQA